MIARPIGIIILTGFFIAQVSLSIRCDIQSTYKNKLQMYFKIAKKNAIELVSVFLFKYYSDVSCCVGTV